MSNRRKAPYNFAARSRKAIVAYLLNRHGRSDQGGSRFAFVWNVKARAVNWDSPKGDYPLDPAFDAAWRLHVAKTHWIAQVAFEDAARQFDYSEWSSYPGDDQGEWAFEFIGRSGGWLALSHWRGSPPPSDAESLAELSFADLRAFYRGIVCLDSDCTPDAAEREVEYQANFQRHLWEEERREEREARDVAAALAIEESRPDMYQGVAP